MEHAGRRAYSNVISYVTRTPWAITPEAFAVVRDVLHAHASGWKPTAEQEQAIIEARAARPTASRSGSVAVIPLQGVLMPRASLFSAMSGATSLDAFSAAVEEAANDPTVAHIVLDVDSPGGVADMVPETAAVVRAAATRKPMTAVANTTCCSAALWIACQAGEFSATESATVGSLGVFAAHMDVSAQREAQGIKTTLIRSAVSPFKAEGNPFEPLSPEALAAIQEQVDYLGQRFVEDVAAGRGDTVEHVAEAYGQGRSLSASQALEAGMIDRVETMGQALSRILGGAPRAGVQANESSDLDGSEPFLPGSEALLARPGFREAYSNGR